MRGFRKEIQMFRLLDRVFDVEDAKLNSKLLNITGV